MSATFSSLVSRIDRLVNGQISLGSTPLSKRQVEQFAVRARFARLFVLEREKYLELPGVDQEIFGTHWGREYLDTVARLIGEGDSRMLNRLRLIYNFSGMPISMYRRRGTFPIHDPVYNRYRRLRAITPPHLRFAAPEICGEAGWKIDRGLCNVDVAVAQERLQFMYFSGALDWARRRAGTRPLRVIEIGAGCGLMASAFVRAFPSAFYVICDVPEVLSIAFAYLSLAMPEHRHIAVLPSGVIDTTTGTTLALPDINSGIVYIPNYMMHRHEAELRVDVAVNAMSLHEMRPAQIAYYSSFFADAASIFFDINQHRGHNNRTNDRHLESVFRYMVQSDLTDLALSARIWTNDGAAFEYITERKSFYRSNIDLDAAFAIDSPYERPPFDHDVASRILNEDVGDLLGVDFDQWMKARNYRFANHLEGYRLRHSL
jgi:hypothetical protein